MVKLINGLKGVPNAVGPYSQAAEAGNLIFLSGQIPLDPETGKLLGSNATEQTEQIMKNLSNVLEGVGLGFDKVAKTTILLTDMNDFGAVNEVYAKWLGEARPARATFAVSGLPLGAIVEIEMIASKQ